MSLVLVSLQSVACLPGKPVPVIGEEGHHDGKKEVGSPAKPAVTNKDRQYPDYDSLARIFPVTMKGKYTISLFLPLYIDSLNREQNQKSALTVSRDFYKGLLIAADTLSKCGLRIDIHTFDSEKRWSFAALQDTLINNGTDLIIGPIQESHIKWMIDSISKKNKINSVSPLINSDKCYNKDFFFQSIPSSANEGIAAARVVKKNFKGYKVFVINEKKAKGISVGETFASRFRKDSITIYDLNGKGASALPAKIPYGDSNVVLIPSNREVFVSAVLTRLRLDSTHLVVIGTMQWQFFKNFEGDLWEKMHVHLLSPYFIDYGNPALNGFIGSYRERYKEEPTVWSFFGFDEMVYYGNMLHDYGKYFQLKINTQNTPLLHTTYRIRHNSGGCGWQNEYVNVLKFENYRLVPVDY
jgi:ABC-type branched-subunit amino acid transport system substrate-binding protein